AGAVPGRPGGRRHGAPAARADRAGHRPLERGLASDSTPPRELRHLVEEPVRTAREDLRGEGCVAPGLPFALQKGERAPPISRGAVVGGEMEPPAAHFARSVQLPVGSRAEEENEGALPFPKLPAEEQERRHAAPARDENRRAAGARREPDAQRADEIQLLPCWLRCERCRSTSHDRIV